MKPQIVKKLLAFTIILLVFSSCAPALIDISSDRLNGVSDGGVSTAGLVLNMAGNKNALYAVGLNSGVWKTQLNATGNFDAWKQLSQSPRYAHCIAIDPNSPSHIAVGERKGDAIVDKNCGLWESFDGGNTFKRKSLIEIEPCRNNIVNALVITNNSTILTSTPNGIGRKEKNETSFTFDPSTQNQSFTSIATFGNWIVARTVSAIFISNTDGKSWDIYNIQFNYPGQNFTQFDVAGAYSVCIIQMPQTNNVFVYVPLVRSPNGPCISPDTGIDPCFPDQPPANPPVCNYSSFLVFSNQTKQWNYQIIRERGLGIGLGGREFMKSFFLSNPNLKNAIGASTNLIYCGSQNIFKATSINDDGTATWENVTNGDVCAEPKPSNIHSDLWDFLIDPSGTYSWVACDGGVYEFGMDSKQTTLSLNSDDKYLNLNSGLHISHIHEAFVAGYLGSSPDDEHYGYSAQDNGGWQSTTTDATTNWKNIYGGDANFCIGDQGNRTFIVTGTNLESAVLQTFENPAPAGISIGTITISHDQHCRCRSYSSSFDFIQTMVNEVPNSNLDAVMLATLPLTFTTDNVNFQTIPQFAGTGGLVIIRNKSFNLTPDINKLTNGNTGWNVELDNLPDGVQGMYVSGGHNDPTYFLICIQSGNTLLFKRKKSESQWTQISLPNNVVINNYLPGTDQHAPVFVNPYNPFELYVSCTDGIYHSSFILGVGPVRGQFTTNYIFNKDAQLTALVSGSGEYPLNRDFPGGDGLNVVHANQSNLNAMFPISGVSFNRYHTGQAVVGSPYTGVFFKNGNHDWEDLSGVLPKPFTPVSSVNINNQGIYVTTEGRGIFKIVNY